VTSVTTPEGAFAADEQFGQRQPGHILQPWPAQTHRGAVGEHHLKPEHVIGGDPVLDAAQTTRVGGDVAADAADFERRRVRRIPQAVLGDRLLHLGVEQARLRHRGVRDRVDGDVPHLLGGQHDAAVERSRTAGQTGAHAAGDHRDAMGAGPAQHGLHLIGATRTDHRHRGSRRRIGGAVVPVGLEDVRIGDDRAVG